MSFPAYEDYKDSGVEWLGRVPTRWEVRRIRNVARLNPSKSEANVVGPDTELSFLPMEAIGERGELDLSRTRPLGEVQQGYSFFADGDVAFAKVTPCFENGKGALMSDLTLGLGFGTTELTVVRPSDPGTGPFLWWFTYSRAFRDPASAEMVGAGGLKRVPDDYVNDCAIPWPPFSEQRAIATFLDRETAKIDALVEAQRRLIELLKEKRQAVISHAVTKGLDPSAPMKDSGVEWLGQVPAHWEVRRFKEVCDEIVDCKNRTPDPCDDSEFLVVRTTCVRDGEFDPAGGYYTDEESFQEWTRKGIPAAGDVLFTREAPAGEACLAPHDTKFCLGQRMMFLRPDRSVMLDEFLLHSIYAPLVREVVEGSARGSTVSHLRVGEVGELRCFCPPLHEQRLIIQWLKGRLDEFSALSESANKAVEVLQERRAALISAAVTGKIDVRDLIQRAEAA